MWRLRTSGLIAFSKLAGFARDLVVAAYFGTSQAADAFNYAYLFTGNVFILFGGLNGPFHSATVSALSGLSAPEQGRFLRYALLRSLLVGIAVSVCLYWLAEPVFGLLLDSADMAVRQLRLMLPVLALTGALGIGFGASCARGRDTAASISPLLTSVAVILAVVFGAPYLGAYSLGLGMSLGAILQSLLQMAELSRVSFEAPTGQPDAAAAGEQKSFRGVLIPALLSSTVGSLNVYVDSLFCAGLQTGSWTAVLLGNRLIQLPFGVLVGGALVSFLPRVSSSTAPEKEFLSELRRLTVLMLPVMAMSLALAEPLVEVAFARGKFGSESIHLVGGVVLGAAGMLLTALPRELGTRVFYGLGDGRTPMLVAVASIASNALLDWLLAPGWGAKGIALATTLAAGLNSCAIVWLLRRRLPGPWEGVRGFPVALLVAASIVGYYLASWSYAVAPGPDIWRLGIAGSAGMALYAGTWQLLAKGGKI